MNDRRRLRPGARREAETGALKRTRRSSQRRLVRTVVLGTLAVAAAIAWLASEFGMDTGELIDYAVTSVMLVLAVVVLALVGAAVLWVIKRLLRHGRVKEDR
jgi:high-affinity Fe2+/Pb2+ permease